MAQSLYAWSITSAISLSRASAKVRAFHPAMVGKHMEPRTPLASMSRTRSCTSKQPGRSSEYVPGLNPHSSLGQPTVADMPNEVLVFSPWNSHWSMPSACTTLGASSSHFLGTWFSYMCGGSIMWSSMLTRIMSSKFMPDSSRSFRSTHARARSNRADRQRLPAPHRRGVGPLGPVVIDIPLREALQHLVEGDAALEARQRRAETEVDAVAERLMAPDIPMNVE